VLLGGRHGFVVELGVLSVCRLRRVRGVGLRVARVLALRRVVSALIVELGHRLPLVLLWVESRPLRLFVLVREIDWLLGKLGYGLVRRLLLLRDTVWRVRAVRLLVILMLSHVAAPKLLLLLGGKLVHL